MGLSTWREHLRDNVYYSGDYIAEEITYTPKGEAALDPFNAIANITNTESMFEMSNEKARRRGTIAIPKSKVARCVRGDRIAYDSSDFLVTGIETENSLNTIVSVDEIDIKSTGGIIKQ